MTRPPLPWGCRVAEAIIAREGVNLTKQINLDPTGKIGIKIADAHLDGFQKMHDFVGAKNPKKPRFTAALERIRGEMKRKAREVIDG